MAGAVVAGLLAVALLAAWQQIRRDGHTTREGLARGRHETNRLVRRYGIERVTDFKLLGAVLSFVTGLPAFPLPQPGLRAGSSALALVALWWFHRRAANRNAALLGRRSDP